MILTPILQPILRPVLRSVLERGLTSTGGGTPGPSYDTDAAAWFSAVAVAGSTITDADKTAVNDFIIGCKADASPIGGVSNWAAMKSVGLFCAASGLAGALVPLKGSAFTNSFFQANDYVKFSGLKGNGFAKWINSNYNSANVAQDNFSAGVYATEAQTLVVAALFGDTTSSGAGSTALATSGGSSLFRCRRTTALTVGNAPSTNVGLVGVSRSVSGFYDTRSASAVVNRTGASDGARSANMAWFSRGGVDCTDARISFAWSGESVNLALLHTRVAAMLAAMADAIAIVSPAPNQIFQRNSSNQADIVISGIYKGTPTSIEARWAGGSWSTIVASPSGGAFIGTLAAQTAGQGTLEVRFSNATTVAGQAAAVGIGEIFMAVGQSNNSGRGVNNQVWSHATLSPGMFANSNEWKTLADPYDSNAAQVDVTSTDPAAAGSIYPLLATELMAALSVPVAVVPCAKGGTAITEWLPGANHLDRTTLYGSANYRTTLVGNARCYLWWQGESDATNGMTQATYNGHLDTIANAFFTDRGLKLMACQFQNCSSISDAAELAINSAIAEAWGDNANVLEGPVLTDLASDDSVHLTSDAKLLIAAQRWSAAILAEFFP